MQLRLKTEKEIEILARGGKILSDILQELKRESRPGVSTLFLNELAKKLIRATGAISAFENYKSIWSQEKFGFALCTSLNEVVVHGKPSEKSVLRDGDVLSLDLGIVYKGLITDAAITVGIGKVGKEKERLIETTKEALDAGVAAAKIGNKISDISKTIEMHIRKNGFVPVRDLVGHGVGFALHEPPEILNYFDPRQSDCVIEKGLVIAIEPMVCSKNGAVVQYQDESFATENKSLSAHFEHTVAVLESGPKILTQ